MQRLCFGILALALGSCAANAAPEQAPRAARLVVSEHRDGVQPRERSDPMITRYRMNLPPGAYMDAYTAQGLPRALKHPRTEFVLDAASADGYIKEPLCQETPTLHVNWPAHQRWGRVLYENFGGYRTGLLRAVRILVEANCAPGQVKAIQLAAFQPTNYTRSEHPQFLDRYEEGAFRFGESTARYVYFGLIVPSPDGYQLVHQNPDGLERYMTLNRYAEGQYARMEASRAAEQRLQREGLGAVISDYCSSQPVVCGALALTVAANIFDSAPRSSAPATNPGDTYAVCMAQCLSKPAAEQPFCQSMCIP